MALAITRPPFSPSPCNADIDPLRHDGNANMTWTPMITCPAHFPPALFQAAVSQLVHHPEYNSTLILRSDLVQDSVAGFPDLVPALQGLRPVRNIHRRLLPRRPTRDSGLEQHCTLYAPSRPTDDDADPEESLHPVVLVLTPVLASDAALPYYHPTVTHLAFRHVPSTTTSGPAALRIEAVPLPGTSLDPGARLYRTCLSLLETLHRYGWGALTQYKKRVAHDVLVPRETYQDLYQVMRERHKHLIDRWQEVTDPLKHVFEDIGIATFLMLLWKDTYGPETVPTDADPSPSTATANANANATGAPGPTTGAEPWRRWPRPPGGFADLGCGNGLLTHILVSEGYAGYGIDLRARKSWTSYPRSTQSRLVVRALDPTAASPLGGGGAVPTAEQRHIHPGAGYDHGPDLSRTTTENDDDQQEEDGNHTTTNSGAGSASSTNGSSGHGNAKNADVGLDVLLPEGCFLIGNHADELTPWMAPLSTLVRASGYLSIPCCAWALDARFDRARDVPFCAVDAGTLNLGGDGNRNRTGEGAGSSYALYRVWLAALSVYCGWAVEVEVLRIPSTRNWAIVGEQYSSGAPVLFLSPQAELFLRIGRKRVGSLDEASRNIEELIEGVRKRGVFKTRRPEGKAGDH
ncbi:hypothetical protein F5148DRAFT_1343224 [Russula earlei]|uniref:Uncharacterized protein n=1 Tax=Russula earlei TaxID=71964 RepID=A0ACC0UDY6_9AGAM|nr:hypothetical protein F5148DRAFT_1343224 [Russula earlei]